MKTVVRAITQYSIEDEHMFMRLYLADGSSELYRLGEQVGGQLSKGGIPEDHTEWLRSFKEQTDLVSQALGCVAKMPT